MLKKKSTLTRLFRNSPFQALQSHMRVVLACAREVRPLIESLASGDQAAILEAKDRIYKFEAKADRIKNKLRLHLPRSLFMPVDRRDLLEILHLQETIANTAQDIAGLTIQRNMLIPEFMRDPIIALTNRCIDTCEQSADVIEELDELLATGFGGRAVDKVDAMLKELNKIERETDDLGATLARTVFEHEGEMEPVSVMMWYQVIEWIGDLADYAEKVGDRLRLLIAK
jgi:predicted phosphate transport protein (TIGR00153 family)